MTAMNVELREAAITITLKPLKPTDPTLPQRIISLPAKRGLFLVFEGYQVDVHPGTDYRVVLDPPSNLASGASKSHELGNLSFARTSGGTGALFASFDITDILRSVAKAK